MLDLKDGLSLVSQLSVFSVLVLQHTVVFLLLTQTCAGQSQLIGPPQPIVAIVGDDIILPCHLDPPMNAAAMTVEWARPDLNPRFVHVWRDGLKHNIDYHPSYRGRTSLSMDKLKLGDVSLKLSDVKLSDGGRYRCFMPSLVRATFIELVVGSVSSPVIEITKSSSGVVLECECKGWYPEPELFWLDGEGNILSAGPPETVRGPDGLYTVSSRVTVEKTDTNSFTCRAQQLSINQTRDTRVQVPDDYFLSQRVVYVTVGLTVLFLSVVAVLFVVWKWRRNKTKKKKDHEDESKQNEGGNKTKSVDNHFELQPLMEGEGNSEAMKDTDENRPILKEELQQKERECKHWEEECDKLMRQKSEREKIRETIKLDLVKLERQENENEKKLQSVRRKSHTDAAEKDEDMNVLLKVKSHLERKKSYLEKRIQDDDKFLDKKEGEINTATERKKKAEEDKEQINMKLKEVEKQRDERERKIQAERQQNKKSLESLEEIRDQQEKPHTERKSQRTSGQTAGEDQVTERRTETDETLKKEEEAREEEREREIKK